MFKLSAAILLITLFTLGNSLEYNSERYYYIRYVNAVVDRNITVTTNLQTVPSYTLGFTDVTDYIPISTASGQGTSVTFTTNGTSLTATPLAVPMYSCLYTTIVIFIDHNNVLNLIPYNESLAESMIDNESDGTMPARSWIRMIGLNHEDITLLISLNNTDTHSTIFANVAYLEATPFVEISSHTQGLVAFISTNSAQSWSIAPQFANSTAYTMFYFSNGVRLVTDRYVPYSFNSTAGSGNSDSDSDSNSESSASGSSPSASGQISSGSSTSATSTGISPISVNNHDDGSSSSTIAIGIASIVLSLLMI